MLSLLPLWSLARYPTVSLHFPVQRRLLVKGWWRQFPNVLGCASGLLRFSSQKQSFGFALSLEADPLLDSPCKEPDFAIAMRG